MCEETECLRYQSMRSADCNLALDHGGYQKAAQMLFTFYLTLAAAIGVNHDICHLMHEAIETSELSGFSLILPKLLSTPS